MAISTKQAYVPPTLRNRSTAPASGGPASGGHASGGHASGGPASLRSSQKKPAKTEFSLTNPASFPSLNEVLNQSKPTNKPMSFSSAAAKKKELPLVKAAEVLPGWVHIRKQNGVIQYKYGAPVPKKNYDEQEEMILGNRLFKYRMAVQQYERDMDVLRLGDLSEYYGEPTLAEIHEENMREMEKRNNSDYYSSSAESDLDDY